MRSTVLLLLLLMQTAFVQDGFAQTGDAAAQASALGMQTVWMPEVTEDILDNGLRVIYTRVNDIPLAEINVIVDGGIMREPENKPGAAYVVNHMLLRGSEDRSRDMTERRLDQLGSIVMPYVHYDYAQIYVKTLTRNFRSTLEVVADAVRRPTFPEEQLRAFKQEASTRLVPGAQSTGERATLQTLRSLCGENASVTKSMLPSDADVSALETGDLRTFHDRWYTPSNTTLIITGNLDFQFVRTLLIEQFGRWTPAAQLAEHADPLPVRAEPSGTVQVIDDTSTTKGLAYYRFGTTVPGRASNDAAALLVMHALFAEGDSSRLRQAMWGENVISPTFTSTLSYSRTCSYMMISGSAPPALADSIVSVTKRVMSRLSREAISDWELQRVKRTLLAESPLLFSSNRNLQLLLKEAVVYGISIEDAMRTRERIAAVTADDVRRMAERVLQPDAFHMTVIGRADALRTRLESLDRDVRMIGMDE